MHLLISRACIINVPNAAQYVVIRNLTNHEESKSMYLSFSQYTTQLGHTFQDIQAYDIHVLI